jgi:hypothetical protein
MSMKNDDREFFWFLLGLGGALSMILFTVNMSLFIFEKFL